MKQQSKRSLSLDIFRGLTVAFMIIVNNQWGPSFRALTHMTWDGCTPTDLVFPFFLFIVGISMWFSYRKQDHEFTKQSFFRLLKRGFLIYAVGFLLGMYPFWNFRTETWLTPSPYAWMGVLQRIGITFFIGGVLALWLKSYKKIIIVAAGILVGYWALINIFGDATFEGYIGRKIDAFIFGRQDNPRFFNNEGFFSTIPAIATVLLGFVTGKFVGENHENKWKVLGVLGVTGGLLVTTALMLNTICPINKLIWSSSYVLYSAGLGMQVWMIFLWIYDYKNYTFGKTFFISFGSNALFIYVIATLINKTVRFPFLQVMWEDDKVNVARWIANWFGSLTTPETGALFSSLVLIGLLFIIAYLLYKRKIFIKI